MIATEKRHIRSGAEYEHLFPKPEGEDILIEKNATVEDTIRFIPQMVSDTLDDTKKIAKVLKADTLYETCRNIWNFVYQHIPYKKDEAGKEQVRRPARVWHDRNTSNEKGEKGVDCDCYTSFISSILSNLYIPHALRICKYWYTNGRYTHIYPIVPTTDGNHITIDCVVNRFDKEEPFTEKKDTPMELHYLNGIEESYDYNEMNGSEFGELGLFKKKKFFNNPNPFDTGNKKPGLFNKVGKIAAKGLNLVNKVNPATTLLRAGFLASMKLNLMHVAEKLRYAYLPEAEAQRRGLNMDRWRKYKQVLDKAQKIFYGAGGNPDNLRAAILTGKGNPGKEVSGLNDSFSSDSPLAVILGEEMYNTEVQTEGMQGLGEPATATAIASASATVAALAALLKNIGDIKQKLLPGRKTDTSEAEVPTDIETLPIPADDGNSLPAAKEAAPGETPAANTSPDAPKEGFWDKNKKWIIPTGIGVGVLGLLYAGAKALKKKEQPVHGLEGHQQYYHKHSGKRRRKHHIYAQKIQG